MLKETQIQALIVLSVQELCNCGSRAQEIPIDARIEALLLVLTGAHQGVGDSTAGVYKAAGIKHRIEGDTTYIDDDELERIGLLSDERGYMRPSDPLLRL